MRYPVRARATNTLQAMATPTTQGGALEAVSWKYFDTQSIVSTTTVSLNFFNTVQSDKTLGNIEQASTIQSPNFFELYSIRCDFQPTVSGSATETAGVLNDIAQILNVQRATYQLTVNSKSYGIVPLTCAHSTGGPVGFSQGTPGTNHMVSFANNSVPDDGDWLGGIFLNPDTGALEECGSIVLQPNQSFALTVSMAAAPTLNGTPLNIRMTLAGVLHRQVR